MQQSSDAENPAPAMAPTGSRPGESTSRGCTRCGETLLPGFRVCPRCGTPTEISSPGISTAAAGDPWARVVERLQDAVAGEYQLVREIGRGGMAAVYLAHDLSLGRPVAIKVMSPGLFLDPGMVHRFRQEAVTIANLSHPNVITIHAVRQVEELHFFVMQFVEGHSLAHVIHTAGALPIPVARAILFMVGSALGYAHKRGVVHRDVKPANILLDGEGNALVTDFGIAKVVEAPKQTQTGMVMGTPAYMSPEQCYAGKTGPASDQYSLGIVAYELLTGHTPFTGSSFLIMQAHTERPAPPVRVSRHDCPEELEAAVARMLAKDPADRWPTMAHALGALGAAPLAEGDPVRAELARLALPDAMLRAGSVLAATPLPLPATSAAPARAPEPYVASISILAPREPIEVGDTAALTASARTGSGATMPGVRFSWSTDAPEIATVDERTGLLTAVGTGTVRVTATSQGLTTTVAVAVVTRRVMSLHLTNPPGVVHAGERVQLEAVTLDKSQRPLHRAVDWATDDPSVAHVDAAGVVTARAPGSVVLWAEAEGVRESLRLEIAPTPVAAVMLANAPERLPVGESFTMRAGALDAAGAPLHGRRFAWVSSDPAVAAVSSIGVVTAQAPGSVTLGCTCEGKRAALTLTVVPTTATAPPAPSPVPPPAPSAAPPEEPIREPSPETPREAPAAASPETSPGTSSETSPEAWLEASPGSSLDPSLDSPLDSAALAGPLAVTASSTDTHHRVSSDSQRSVRTATRLPRAALLALPAVVAAAAAAFLLRGGDELMPTREVGPGAVLEGEGPPSGASGATAGAAGLPGASAAGPDGTLPGSAGDASSALSSGTLGEPSTREPAAAARLQVTAPSRALRVGDAVNLDASILSADGTRSAAGGVRWRSSAPAVARVDSRSGRVTALAAGGATVTATLAELSATVRLRVEPRPAESATQGEAGEAPRRAEGAVSAPATPDVEGARSAARAAAGSFVAALRARDGERLRTLAGGGSTDQRSLQRLIETVERGLNATASDPQAGELSITGGRATMEFRTTVTWRSNFGGQQERTAVVVVQLDHSDGEWRPAGYRVTRFD